MIRESNIGKGFLTQKYTNAYADAHNKLSQVPGLNYNNQTPDVQQVLNQVYADSTCYHNADFFSGVRYSGASSAELQNWSAGRSIYREYANEPNGSTSEAFWKKVLDTINRPNSPFTQYDVDDTNRERNLGNLRFDRDNTGQVTGIAAPVTPVDPILIDLNGDGIKTTNIFNGEYFDHENDGFAELSSWVSKDDGILYYDKNNNGKIDNGNEIFGNNYIKNDGTKATSGFDALLDLDSNNDGVIDELDDNFTNIKIQKGDGTQLSLSEAGIESISLTTTESNIVDENGNTQEKISVYTKKDGSTGQIGEYDLQVNSRNTISSIDIDIPEDILELPFVAGSGNVYDIYQAMVLDDTNELKNLVLNFISTDTNEFSKMDILEQILFKWTNVDNIEENSRGENVNAKHLVVLEKFMGQGFWSTYDEKNGGENPANPNLNAGQMIETQYEEFKISIYSAIAQQTFISDLVDITDYNVEKSCFDFSAVTLQLIDEIQENAETGKIRAIQFVKALKGAGIEKNSNYFDPFDDNCLYTALTKDDRELKWQFDTIGTIPYTDLDGEGEGTGADDSYRAEEDEDSHFHALTGDDVMYGDNGNDHFAACNGDDILDGGDGDDLLDSHDGNDIIFGGAGNDIIHAAAGNDIIFGGDGDDTIYPDHFDDFLIAEDGDDIIRGGKGNDTIYSFVGNDTFIFNLGDGQDTVYEHQGVDTFCFGTDIEWEEYVRR